MAFSQRPQASAKTMPCWGWFLLKMREIKGSPKRSFVMENIQVWLWPVVTVVFSAIGGFIGALLHGKFGREVERDRFRHEITSTSWAKNVEYHTELFHLVSAAYQAKRNRNSAQFEQDPTELKEMKNFYHDNRFSFSDALCSPIDR